MATPQDETRASLDRGIRSRRKADPHPPNHDAASLGAPGPSHIVAAIDTQAQCPRACCHSKKLGHWCSTSRGFSSSVSKPYFPISAPSASPASHISLAAAYMSSVVTGILLGLQHSTLGANTRAHRRARLGCSGHRHFAWRALLT